MINAAEKLCGILVPVFALRHAGDFGIGDTTAMTSAIDFCASNNIGVLQVLPINETGADNSPYNAISSVALEPALLTMTPYAVPSLSNEMLVRIAPEGVLSDLREGLIDYPRVKALKYALLAAAFEFFEHEHILKNTAEAEDLQFFEMVNSSWLPAYTLFRTLIDEHSGNTCWTEWKPAVQTFPTAMKYSLNSPDRVRIQKACRFWAFVQWVAFRQWKNLRGYAESKGVKLMGDLPFGISRYSADVWAERELFDLDWSCGAPPETFFKADAFTAQWGQNWGFPLYRWEAHKRQNFFWWRQRVAKLTEIFHFFRIDHVLGFFRIYAFPWIPEKNDKFVNCTPEQAASLCSGKLPQFLPRADEPPEAARQNAKEGKAILEIILEASGNNSVVAEDLGVVPGYVRAVLAELGIPGFSIPIFERNEEDRSFKDKKLLPELSVATYATHDHLPLVLFYEDLVKRWHGPHGHESWLELQRLMRFLGLDEHNPPLSFTTELHLAFMHSLLETPCWLVVFMITDLLALRDQFNAPGSSSYTNWSFRLDESLNYYENIPEYALKIRSLKELIKQTNRQPKPQLLSGSQYKQSSC